MHHPTIRTGAKTKGQRRMIDRNTPIPLYYQLENLIKQQIQSGLLKPGDQLPTEQELCDRYDISRAPVRQALALLAQQGIIYRRPGIGTFVAKSGEESLPRQATLRLMTHEQRWISLLTRAMEQQKEEHPKSEINLEATLTDRAGFHQLLSMSAAQGNAPDLVTLDYIWMTSYARSAYITPLEELDEVWAETLSADLEHSVYRNHMIDGQLCGLPIETDVTGLWYRRDWFEAEGLEPPVTWNDLQRILEHFARPETRARFGHHHALAFPGGTSAGEATVNTLFPFIWSAGGDLFDDQQTLSLASPAVYRALRFLQSLAQEPGYVAPGLDLEWYDPARLLARGEVALSCGGTYEWPVISEETGWEGEKALMAHLDFVPIPRPTRDTPPVASLGGTTWCVLRQSTLHDLSLDLLKRATTDPWILDFHGEGLQISPFKSVNRKLAEAHPWLRRILSLVRVARPRPKMKQYTRVSRFLQQMFEEVLWHKAPVEATVRQTLNYLALLLQD